MTPQFPKYYHVGCLKTGTTTLQEILRQDSRINLILYSRYFNTNNYYYQDYNYVDQELINIESDENLVRNNNLLHGLQPSLRRIAKVRRDAIVVFTFREQREMLISAYKHHISKTRDHFNFEEFINSRAGITFLETARYFDLIQTARNFFAEDQIRIFLFEEMKQDFDKYIFKFYQSVFGIEPPETEPIKLNRGLSENSLAYQKSLNKYVMFPKGSRLHRIEKKVTGGILKRTVKSGKRNDRLIWPTSSLFKGIEQELTSQNRKLAETYNLDLYKYGYLL